MLINELEHTSTIIDYKTSSKPYTQANAERYYQLQMDAYALLCERHDMYPVKEALLVFFTPSVTSKMVNETSSASFVFDVTIITLAVSSQRAKDTIAAVQKVVELDKAPKAAADCRWCNW
jgi:RecB family exonuclease